MSKQEVLQIMGTKTKTCYDPFYLIVVPLTLGLFLPVALMDTEKVANPYRSETLESESTNRRFYVLYYYTEVKGKPYAVTDDQLTPLVFENDKLIGWGPSFLNDKVLKYGLRIR